MSIYEASITNPKKQLEFYKQLSEQLQKENLELKRQLSNSHQIKNQQKEFINFLENEKLLLCQRHSASYEDGLGNIKYVDEAIFNEVNKILKEYKEIIGKDINVSSKG